MKISLITLLYLSFNLCIRIYTVFIRSTIYFIYYNKTISSNIIYFYYIINILLLIFTILFMNKLNSVLTSLDYIPLPMVIVFGMLTAIVYLLLRNEDNSEYEQIIKPSNIYYSFYIILSLVLLGYYFYIINQLIELFLINNSSSWNQHLRMYLFNGEEGSINEAKQSNDSEQLPHAVPGSEDNMRNIAQEENINRQYNGNTNIIIQKNTDIQHSDVGPILTDRPGLRLHVDRTVSATAHGKFYNSYAGADVVAEYGQSVMVEHIETCADKLILAYDELLDISESVS